MCVAIWFVEVTKMREKEDIFKRGRNFVFSARSALGGGSVGFRLGMKGSFKNHMVRFQLLKEME
ncbi:MAG: hypothetical protein ACE5IF_05680 [Candidatus Bathyarchaeia archaeon]